MKLELVGERPAKLPDDVEIDAGASTDADTDAEGAAEAAPRPVALLFAARGVRLAVRAQGGDQDRWYWYVAHSCFPRFISAGSEEKTSLTMNGTNSVLVVPTECVFADRIKVEEDEYEYGQDGEGEIEGVLRRSCTEGAI